MTVLVDPPEVTVVTGGAGWLGTSLMTALTNGGEWSRTGTIRVLVTNRVDAERLAALGDERVSVEPVIGDIRSDHDVAALFDGLASRRVDVLHNVGVIHPGAIADFETINVGGTERVMRTALHHGARRVVHVSSNSPFGINSHPGDRFSQHEPYHPYLEYGRSKMAAELAVADAVSDGLNAVMVRPPWFYGPHQPARQTTFFRMVRTGRFPMFGRGEQSRSMTYIDNLVQGVMRAELVDTEPGLGWWVADARPYTIAEVVDTVGRALADSGYDVTPNRLRAPSFVGDLAERADGIVQRLGRYQQQLHVLGEMNKSIACDISATERDLGYAPAVELYGGMRSSIDWCQRQGYEL